MAEIRRVCQEDEPGPILKRLGEMGLLKCVHPGLKLNPKQIDRFRRVARVREWYRLTFGERYSPIWLVWFLALTEELDQEDVSAMVENLDLGRKAARVAVEERKTLREILVLNRRLRQKDTIKPSEADRIFSGLSWPGILYLIAMDAGDNLARAGAAYLIYYRQVKTSCDGKDLIRLGFTPGPRLHEALIAIREARLDGVVSDLGEEIELAKRLLMDENAGFAR
jgi:tRNA nucleotidyltransferase (CCA-adding enzyme)